MYQEQCIASGSPINLEWLEVYMLHSLRAGKSLSFKHLIIIDQDGFPYYRYRNPILHHKQLPIPRWNHPPTSPTRIPRIQPNQNQNRSHTYLLPRPHQLNPELCQRRITRLPSDRGSSLRQWRIIKSIKYTKFPANP